MVQALITYVSAVHLAHMIIIYYTTNTNTFVGVKGVFLLCLRIYYLEKVTDIRGEVPNHPPVFF